MYSEKNNKPLCIAECYTLEFVLVVGDIAVSKANLGVTIVGDQGSVRNTYILPLSAGSSLVYSTFLGTSLGMQWKSLPALALLHSIWKIKTEFLISGFNPVHTSVLYLFPEVSSGWKTFSLSFFQFNNLQK